MKTGWQQVQSFKFGCKKNAFELDIFSLGRCKSEKFTLILYIDSHLSLNGNKKRKENTDKRQVWRKNCIYKKYCNVSN